jgi:hypothetical protein
MTRLAIIAAVLLIASAAQAQTQLNTTPTGAAVPSEQQTTGSAAVAPHGADRTQTPTGAPSGNATHPDEAAKGLTPGNAASAGRGMAPNQSAR